MPLETLRMLADQLYTVLMTLVEGESFDILVGEKGKKLGGVCPIDGTPLTTGRARGLLRSFLLDVPSWESCKEQWNGCRTWRGVTRKEEMLGVACRGHRMAALEELLPKELERHCQLQPMVTLGHVPETGRRSRSPRESKRIRCTGKGKEGKMVQSHHDKRTRRRCWNCGNQVINRRIAGQGQQQQSQGQSNAPGKGNDVKGKLEHLFGISKLQVQLRARWRRLHRRVKQALNARWIAINVDTGVGGTVWPMNADYAREKVSGPTFRNYKMAPGDSSILPVAARREGCVAGDAERMMDDTFVGHHERTGA